MEKVNTGWREVTPGACSLCGGRDRWECDGRGNVLCECQACEYCGVLDAYGFHDSDCPTLYCAGLEGDGDSPKGWKRVDW